MVLRQLSGWQGVDIFVFFGVFLPEPSFVNGILGGGVRSNASDYVFCFFAKIALRFVGLTMFVFSLK